MAEIVHVSPMFFGDAGVWGGGERYPLELARALSEHVSTRLVTFGPRSSRRLDGRLSIQTLRARGRWKGSEINPIAPGLIAALAGAKTIHTHHYKSTVTNACLLLARGRRQEMVCTDHGGGGHDFSARLGLDAHLNSLLAVSQFSADRFPQFADRTCIIFGGVDVGRYHRTNVPRERAVLFVGRLLPHKGIDLLIEAVDATTPLWIIGRPYDTAYLTELRRLASGKRVSFSFEAADADVIDAMRRASVVVLPSLQKPRFAGPAPYAELLGLVLLEAMACGTPVIASGVGGVPEILPDGVVGRLFPQGDIRALTEALGTVLDDRVTWGRMSRAAEEHVRTSFTWDEVARRCLAAYRFQR